LVVGHYGCGGIGKVIRCERVGLADNWLRHVQDVREKHDGCLHRLPDDTARSSRLCELNVVEQVFNVASTTIVQDAWARGQELTVHGWIYGLRDGLLRDLKMSASDLPETMVAYKAAVAAINAGDTTVVPW
jgi:carbonic anhydrase